MYWSSSQRTVPDLQAHSSTHYFPAAHALCIMLLPSLLTCSMLAPAASSAFTQPFWRNPTARYSGVLP